MNPSVTADILLWGNVIGSAEMDGGGRKIEAGRLKDNPR
jgi:hypothetical protein